MQQERIIALDVGDRRIGIAVSDLLGIIAQPIETYTRVGYGPDVRHISAICEKYDTTRILCGLPKNMDGTQGGQAQKVRDFAQQLENAGLSVAYWDERLTTVSAERVLIEGDVSRQGRKQKIDMVAAVVILQAYLDAGGLENKRNEAIQMDDNNQLMDDENVIELVDEDGETVQFEHLMTLEHEDELYVVLTMLEATPDTDEDEVFVLRIDKDDQDEDCYVTIDDEDVMQAVFDKFVALAEQDEADTE